MQNSFEHFLYPFYDQGYRQQKIVVDFLCQLNELRFLENHAHMTLIDHCIVVCTVVVVVLTCVM